MFEHEDEYTQVAEHEEAPFHGGIGGEVAGGVHVDGTPFRVATFIVLGVLILVVFNQGGFRFHVTV